MSFPFCVCAFMRVKCQSWQAVCVPICGATQVSYPMIHLDRCCGLTYRTPVPEPVNQQRLFGDVGPFLPSSVCFVARASPRRCTGLRPNLCTVARLERKNAPVSMRMWDGGERLCKIAQRPHWSRLEFHLSTDDLGAANITAGPPV